MSNTTCACEVVSVEGGAATQAHQSSATGNFKRISNVTRGERWVFEKVRTSGTEFDERTYVYYYEASGEWYIGADYTSSTAATTLPPENYTGPIVKSSSAYGANCPYEPTSWEVLRSQPYPGSPREGEWSNDTITLSCYDPECFDAKTLSCRVAPGNGARLSARRAHRHCFGATAGASDQAASGQAPPNRAALVQMEALRAGDLVLTRHASGLALARVLVVQHLGSRVHRPLLEISHAAGSLRLTSDHLLVVDGSFTPARLARVGSSLSLADGTLTNITRVRSVSGRVINPVTSSGTILAAAAGAPVLSSTHPEWSAPFTLASAAPAYPCFQLLSYLFPQRTQAYYDMALEPLFRLALLPYAAEAAAAPTALLQGVALAADATAAAGFLVFALSTPSVLLAVLVALLASIKVKGRSVPS